VYAALLLPLKHEKCQNLARFKPSIAFEKSSFVAQAEDFGFGATVV
jgi:hypothetical protein